MRALAFEGRPLRVLHQRDDIWWLASDLCDALDLPKDARSLRSVRRGESDLHALETRAGVQMVALVSTAGAQTVARRSQDPAASRFWDWVCHEVEPALARGLLGDLYVDSPEGIVVAGRAERSDSTSPFDALRSLRADGSEYWSARELMPVLGYERWENMAEVLDRATAACRNSGEAPDVNFRGVTKKSSGRGRPSEDVELTRYAAYLVAMNGDPRKPEIAAAQTYFAVRTREAETGRAGATDGGTDLAALVLDELRTLGNRIARLEGTVVDLRAQLASRPALPIPAQARFEFEEDDEPAWAGFFRAWHDAHGLRAVRARDLLDAFLACPPLSSLVREAESDFAVRQRFGHILKRSVGRAFDGLRIDRARRDGRSGASRYRLVSEGAAPE